MKVVGNLQILGQKSIIKFNPDPSKNLEYSGWISDGIADQNLTKGQLVCYNTMRYTWALAKADDLATLPARGIALDDIIAGDTGKILRFGTFRNDWSKSTYNLTTPFIYVSPTDAGEYTKDCPNIPGQYIQKIGSPVKNNVGWFDFNTTIFKIGPLGEYIHVFS